MKFASSDENDLLTALHEGAFDQPLWSTFLDRLKARVMADSASILFRGGDRAGAEVTELRSGRTTPKDIQQRYHEALYRLDPIPYTKLRPGRVYALSEFLDPADTDHARFQKEIIEPTGMRYARLMRVEEPGGAEAWCILSREDRDFLARDSALLAALGPHLRIALRGFMAIQRERLRASISADVVERLNFGWLTLDASGHVVDVDRQGERLLQRSSVLKRTRHGRLLPASPPAGKELSQLLRAASAGAVIRPRLIHLSDEPWLDMLVLPIAGETTPQKERPVLAVYLQGDQQPGPDRRDQLMGLFGLSLNEAKLALALSRGRTIAEAAADLGLTVQSARTYSKRIYLKTSTRGQSDLIRLVLASVIALA